MNHTRKEQGFSLIEVTIAMAIASIAIITLVGLIPQGMATMREAGDRAIEGRVQQQLLSEMQMANFERIDDFDGLEVYYDAQGEELGDNKSSGESSAEGSFEHIYSARVNVPGAGGGSLPPTVGGGSFSGVSFDGGTAINGAIRVVILEIAVVGGQGENFDWASEENRGLISTHQTYVVDMGQKLE